MKIDNRGLYDSLGSPEARRSYEEGLAQRLQQKLYWLRRKAEIWSNNAASFEKHVNAHPRLSDEQRAEVTKLEDDMLNLYDSARFYKAEWEDTAATASILVGEPPDDDLWIDIDALEEAVASFRERYANERAQEENTPALLVSEHSTNSRGRGRRPWVLPAIVTLLRQRTSEQLRETTQEGLATELGCSRTTIRAALRLISEEGDEDR
jgi:hypothetical protein